MEDILWERAWVQATPENTAFVLTGVGTWVGKPTYLAVDPLTIQEGQWEIAQAVTECQIKARGPGHPCVNPSTLQPFRFNQQGDSPQKDTPGDATSDHQLLPQQPLRGWNCNWHRKDQGVPPPQPTLPSLDHGFESDRSSVSTALLMSSLSDRSEGSQHPWWGRQCGVARAHMKINLPIFKDEDTKDAVTYQSRRWDLIVYHCPGCRDLHSSGMPSSLCKVTPQNWYRAQGCI